MSQEPGKAASLAPSTAWERPKVPLSVAAAADTVRPTEKPQQPQGTTVPRTTSANAGAVGGGGARDGGARNNTSSAPDAARNTSEKGTRVLVL